MSSFPNEFVGNPSQGDFLDSRLKHPGMTAYSRYDAFMRWLLADWAIGRFTLVFFAYLRARVMPAHRAFSNNHDSTATAPVTTMTNSQMGICTVEFRLGARDAFVP